MNNKKVLNFYIFAYIVLFLQSMHVWFLWGNLFKIACPILFLCAAYFNHIKNPNFYEHINFSKQYLFLIILVFISLQESYDAGILSICKSMVGVIALYELIKINDTSCKRVLNVFTKIFGIISIVSLVGWILFLIGINLPHAFIEDKEFGYSFDNYYIFLYNRYGIFPRYCSIFLEPGYYGQLAAVLLFANMMKLNNIYTISIFISALFSLSLAGYVLIIIGYIFININKENIWKLAFLFLVGFAAVNIAKNYNGGDNPINGVILSRLEIEDGQLTGYNRTTEELDSYFSHGFFQNEKYLFGHGSGFSKMVWGRGVAGYKAYILEHGYVGFILAIWGYLIVLYRKPKTNNIMKLCFILFMTLYWQAAYPYWFGFFSIYIFSLASLRNKTNQIK